MSVCVFYPTGLSVKTYGLVLVIKSRYIESAEGKSSKVKLIVSAKHWKTTAARKITRSYCAASTNIIWVKFILILFSLFSFSLFCTFCKVTEPDARNEIKFHSSQCSYVFMHPFKNSIGALRMNHTVLILYRTTDEREREREKDWSPVFVETVSTRLTRNVVWSAHLHGSRKNRK